MFGLSKTSKGFTIIELIVVIAIIAVLAGIVLVNVQGYIKKAKDAAMKSELDALYKLSVLAFEQNGNYNDFYLFPGYSKIASGINKYGNTIAIYTPLDKTKICLLIYNAANMSDPKFCVDYTGKKTFSSSPPQSGMCNASYICQ